MSRASSRVDDEEPLGIIILGAAFMMLLLAIALQSANIINIFILTQLIVMFIVVLRIVYKMTLCAGNC